MKIGSGGNDWRPFLWGTDEVLQSNGYTAFKYAVARETIPLITCLTSGTYWTDHQRPVCATLIHFHCIVGNGQPQLLQSAPHPGGIRQPVSIP